MSILLDQPRALTSWMEVLADPTRLRLLRLLERHELGVTDLCDIVQMPQSTVSRHLKLLVEGGWLQQRRRATANLYRMILDDVAPAAKRLWALARGQVCDSPMFRQDQLRLRRRLQQRKAGPSAFFAGAAGQWDRIRAEQYGGLFVYEAMLALLPSHWTVVDLGCGTGQITATLAGHVLRVIGVDASEAMLRAAGKQTAGLKNVTLRRDDLEAVGIEDGSCDAALIVLVLTYVADVSAVLSEAARILRPGGRLVVVDLLRHDRDDFRRQMGQESCGFETEDLVGLLDDAGLSHAAARHLPPEPNVKGPALVLATAQKFQDGKKGD